MPKVGCKFEMFQGVFLEAPRGSGASLESTILLLLLLVVVVAVVVLLLISAFASQL